MGKTILVTVGSTHFEDLIHAVDSEPFVDWAAAQGFSKIVIQYGSQAVHHPDRIVSICSQRGIALECFARSEEFAEYVKAADIIISHAGAGSVLEGLEQRKQMVVVVNDALMHNHQTELAGVMSDNGHVFCTTPGGLLTTLNTADFTCLRHLPPAQTTAFSHFLDTALGF